MLKKAPWESTRSNAEDRAVLRSCNFSRHTEALWLASAGYWIVQFMLPLVTEVTLPLCFAF